MSDLSKDIERVKAVLAEPLPEPSPKPLKRRLTMAKKANGSDEGAEKTKKVKKVTKGAKKTEKPAKGKETDPNTVTIAQLATEAGIGPQSARVKLREANVERPEGRWVWPQGSKALREARKTLGLAA